MKIAIDGMGGDNAPKAVIEGVIQALKEYEGIEYYITGPKEQIEEELKKYQYDVPLPSGPPGLFCSYAVFS